MAGIKGEVTALEPTRAEQALARRAAEARATVPDLEFAAEVDMSRAATLGHPTEALLVRACALALREVPRANGAYRDGRYELYSRVNVAVVMLAASEPASPTVFDADRKTLAQLEAELAELRERADRGELTASQLAGATFTLADFGPLGVSAATPPPAPSQAATLAAGAVQEVPRASDGAIVPSPTMTLTLVSDGRILYGAHAARFLRAVRDRLEAGEL